VAEEAMRTDLCSRTACRAPTSTPRAESVDRQAREPEYGDGILRKPLSVSVGEVIDLDVPRRHGREPGHAPRVCREDIGVEIHRLSRNG
jgi:hypothetical protein